METVLPSSSIIASVGHGEPPPVSPLACVNPKSAAHFPAARRTVAFLLENVVMERHRQ